MAQSKRVSIDTRERARDQFAVRAVAQAGEPCSDQCLVGACLRQFDIDDLDDMWLPDDDGLHRHFAQKPSMWS